MPLPDAEATTAFGASLARALSDHRGAVLYLVGDLGAGKTTLARGLLRELGVSGAIRSPTYTLLEPYETPRGPVLHMDLYRLTNALELENLGLEDYPPAQTLWLVEWPDRGGALLPAADIELRLAHCADGRQLNIEAAPDFAAVLERLSATVR